jgi:archaellum component FlaF (FlaF/FlaG flagellin family)
MSPAVYIPPSSFWSYGTSDPSGGSNGDFYFKTDGTNVLSVWKKNAGTWASVAAFGTGSGGGAGSTAAISVSGTQDGSNKTFTLSSAITAGVGLVFINGQLLIPGSSNDYVISGTTLTIQAACPAPLSTDVVQVFGYTDTATVVTGTSEVAVTGTQNSSNKTFTISNAINGVALVFLNGQLLTSGSSNDYTVSGTTLTFTSGRAAPLSTDVIRVMGYVSGATVVPNGGAAGQALVKNSGADGDVLWADRGQVLISRQVLAAPAATFSFASLPTTFRHLRVVVVGRSTSTNAYELLKAQFNGDTTDANYTASISNYGTSGASTTLGYGYCGAINGSTSGTDEAGSTDFTIYEYRSTVWRKNFTGIAYNYRAGSQFGFTFGSRWANTAAITSLVIANTVGPNFDTGTICYLYGIN